MGHGKIGGENLWENGTISRNLWEKWFTHGKVGGRSQADVEMEWQNVAQFVDPEFSCQLY